MVKRYVLFLMVSVSIVAACGPRGADPVAPADIIFIGKNIVTIDDALENIDAVAVRGEIIVAVGSRSDVLALRGSETRVIELGERALLPGFIDAHGHVTSVARILDVVDLSAPPVGTTGSIDDVIRLLKERLQDEPPEPGSWLMGFGYDESMLSEKRHPTRDDLDKVSAETPIALIHVSGHLAVANSAALQAASIDADTKDPAGGIIRRRPDSREPNGVLEETAATGIVLPLLFSIRGEELVQKTRQAIDKYLRNGITTIQDGAAFPPDIQALADAASVEPFSADVAAYVMVERLPATDVESFAEEPEYKGGFRVAGAKLTIDGSVQGLTAWLTEPYRQGPPGIAADYRAYPRMAVDDYQHIASTLLRNGVPTIVHANGDAAIDAMLDGVENAAPGMDHRSVIIHAQLMRKDQIERAATLGVIPSFFSAHPFFWGDWHREILGDARAENISPIRWAADAKLRWTIHNDAPIVPPNMMRLMGITVNRQTRSGYVLGEHQRASVMEALHAVTLGAAYQYFEEDRKGSITIGKQADLVILASNPLTADPGDLANIAVVETFARGKSVYSGDAGAAR